MARYYEDSIRNIKKMDETELILLIEQAQDELRIMRLKKEKEKVGTCELWGKKVNIYGYQEKLGSVLTKVYPNICNDFKDYDWQVYGVTNINLGGLKK